MKLYKRTHMCGELRKENIGEKVVLNGWVAKRRNLGGLIFCDVRDKTGITQVVFNDKIPQELFEQADSLRSEYVVGIQGVVAERESKNPDLPTGDIEIIADDMILYSKADTPPIYIKDDDNVDDNLRLKYRYLDLRKKKMQDNLTFPSQPDKTGQRLFRRKRIYRSRNTDADQVYSGRRQRLSGTEPCESGTFLRSASVTADL